MNQQSINARQDRWALVTGASAGIGAEFCRQLAAMNYSIVLVSRRQDRLEQLAADLQDSYGVRTLCIPTDLSQPDSCQILFDRLETEQLEIEFLVNNAGYGVAGHFTHSSWETHQDFIQVLVTAVCDLTWRILPGMQQRGKGYIVNVASVAGHTPGSAGSTLYCASKAFLVRFSESIAVENAETGVNISALCPGFTYSEFHDVMETRDIVSKLPPWMWQTAEEVVRFGIHAVSADPVKIVAIPGFVNRLIVMLARVLPQPIGHALMRRQSRHFRESPVDSVQSAGE